MSGSINTAILYPLTQFAFDNSQAGVTVSAKPTIIIAQTITPQPSVITPVFSVAQARSLFGRGSSLARMFAAYFALDTLGPIYTLPLPDPTGGTAASGAFTFTGPATAAGTMTLYIAGQRVTFGVAVGDAGTVLATNCIAACTALPDLPVVATVFGGTAYKVAITAKNAGLLGNNIDLRLNYFGLASGEQLPAGVTVAVIPMAGGAGTPTLTGIAGILGDQNFRFILHPYSAAFGMTAFAALMSFAGGRWDPTRKSWGHCWTARTDLAANLLTYGATNNDPHSTVFAYETGSPTPPDEAAALFCAAAAASLRAQPNQPVQTLQMPGFMPPNASGGAETAWNATVWQSLLGAGLAVAKYQGGTAAILRAPTTYQVNGYGQPDQSYFDTEDLYLLMAQSDYLQSTISQKFGRVMIADDGTVVNAGVPVVTPKSIKAEVIACYLTMELMGWVEDVDAFIAASSVTRSLTNPSAVSIFFDPFQVVGLRQVGVLNQFRKFSAAAAAVLVAA